MIRDVEPTVHRAPKRLQPIERTALPWLLTMPAVVLVVAVTFLPVIEAVVLSFRETFYLEQGRFVGFRHYLDFFRDPLGARNITNSLIFTFGSLALAVPLGITLALMLNKPRPGLAFFRTALILPWVVSQLLTALLWRFFYNPLIGPLSYALGELTNSRVDILGHPQTAMLGLIIANVWRSFPYAMILILAALQTIPRELYEAARVDGANAIALFVNITFPWIRNTLLIVVIILSIHYFNMIEIPLVLTGGGPASATDLIGLRVYRDAFVVLQFGAASAIAMLMFVVNIGVSLVYIKVLRTESHT